jgi:hypothetical protein
MTQPIKRFKCGSYEAAVFENQINRNGKPINIKKVAIQKRYKSSDDSWKSTYSLDLNDLPKMCLALQKAYEFLALSEGTTKDEANNEI